MKFTLTLESNADEFVERGEFEDNAHHVHEVTTVRSYALASVIKAVAERVRDDATTGIVRDGNGQRIGAWSIEA